jgi:hypothetical protein
VGGPCADDGRGRYRFLQLWRIAVRRRGTGLKMVPEYSAHDSGGAGSCAQLCWASAGERTRLAGNSTLPWAGACIWTVGQARLGWCRTCQCATYGVRKYCQYRLLERCVHTVVSWLGSGLKFPPTLGASRGGTQNKWRTVEAASCGFGKLCRLGAQACFVAGCLRGLVDRLLGTDPGLSWISPEQLMGVEAFLAHHHAGDVGPPPAWGGIADDGPDAPCAVAGMFGCAPMNSTYDYWKNGVPWEGPPVVFH